jgi:hypothetical protein
MDRRGLSAQSEASHSPPAGAAGVSLGAPLAFQPASPLIARVPPWELDQRERPTLQACAAAFAPWIRGPVYSRRNTRPSKFEGRVLEILGALFGPDMPVVREVVLPVRVDGRLRRLMDDLQAGDFQLGSTIELRIDFAFLEPGTAAGAETACSRLRLIEVDGSQHGAASHFFHGLAARHSSLPRALRRDMLKDAVVAAAGVRLLRLGPDCERDTHPAKVLILRRLAAFATGSAPQRPSTSEAAAPAARKAASNFESWAAALRGRGARSEMGRKGGSLMGLAPAAIVSRSEGVSAVGARTAPRERAAKRQGGPRRSRSAPAGPRRREPGASLLLLMPRTHEEEAQRKIRTLYNRSCKDRVRRRLGSGPRIQAALQHIAERQLASDSRKRPRDDTGATYEPRWFKAARRWHERQQRLCSEGSIISVQHPLGPCIPCGSPIAAN